MVRSTDGGKTWTDISANLPQAPVDEVILAGKRIYVDTDVGVFVTKAASIHWESVGTGLPNVPVNDLRYIAKDHTLYAGTFGHGVWSLALGS